MATDASSHMAEGPGEDQTFGGVIEGEAYLPRKGKRAPMTPGYWVVDHLEEGSLLGCYCPGLLSPPACGLLLLRGLSEVALYL